MTLSLDRTTRWSLAAVKQCSSWCASAMMALAAERKKQPRLVHSFLTFCPSSSLINNNKYTIYTPFFPVSCRRHIKPQTWNPCVHHLCGQSRKNENTSRTMHIILTGNTVCNTDTCALLGVYLKFFTLCTVCSAHRITDTWYLASGALQTCILFYLLTL